jgi:hypothetical protein
LLDAHPYLLVASPAEIVQVKLPAGRTRMTKHEALRMESERALVELIRRHLALPMEKRTLVPCILAQPFFGL